MWFIYPKVMLAAGGGPEGPEWRACRTVDADVGPPNKSPQCLEGQSQRAAGLAGSEICKRPWGYPTSLRAGQPGSCPELWGLFLPGWRAQVILAIFGRPLLTSLRSAVLVTEVLSVGVPEALPGPPHLHPVVFLALDGLSPATWLDIKLSA